MDSVFHVYEKYRLDQVNTVTIGNDPANDICYKYQKLVSRNHAVIEREGTSYRIVNKSINGTYVNSRKIAQSQTLEWGAYINIMGLHLVFLGNILAVDVTGSCAQINRKKLTEYTMYEEETVYLKRTYEMSEGKTIYHRAPRGYESLDEETIEIEAPPQMNLSRQQPLYLTVGPSVTMALPMLLGCMMTITASGRNGTGSSLYMYSGLIMSVTSAAIGIGWALANIRYQKKEEEKQAKERFNAYSAYLIEKTEEVKQKYDETAALLTEMYPDPASCLSYDGKDGVLWNRNASHQDFLNHRLGTGTIPFQIEIDIPKKRFQIYQDELAEKPGFLRENYSVLYDVPVTLDLKEHSLIGIVGGKHKQGAMETAKCIAAQIAANNCYTDVKMGFIFDKKCAEEEKAFRFAKWLPHVWSEDKKTRYLAADEEQTGDVSYELTRIFRSRLEETKRQNEAIPKPWYVLFISNLRALEGELLARYIFDKEAACGLTTILLTERYEELPNACDFIVEHTDTYQGMYAVSDNESKKQKIDFDKIEDNRLEQFARHLSTLQVQEMEKGGEIPASLTFFDMFGIHRPDELSVRERWAKNRTYDNIKGVIGQKAGGVHCYLDVHEKYHGPHGLVAGTTGSGKSETLQTYMMSLAVNYSPDDARLINLSGRVDMTGNSVKLFYKKKAEYTWVEHLETALQESLRRLQLTLKEALREESMLCSLMEMMYECMHEMKLEYPSGKYNDARLEDFIRLYDAVCQQDILPEDMISELLKCAAEQKIKLPQKKEKTQLDAIKEYLAAMAEENGYQYRLQLWMPVLGTHIYLDEFAEYSECRFEKGVWPEHAKEFSLAFVLGKTDDPENQNQMPLILDFAEDGHIAVCGSIVSGRSTMLQTMAYALIQRYSPELVTMYALDFSSKMMSAFEMAPHMGGIMYETDTDKISKFFNMMHTILEERKALFRGGNYSQYVKVHGVTLPAILIFIDNYASFKEKTNEKYEDFLIRLSKEGVSHGIFLIVTGTGFGRNDITARVGENINTILCLSLQDKFAYADLLHSNQIEVMPEGGIHGRGLVLYGGRVLEYQTALALKAENDYQRMEQIRLKCEEMKCAWQGKSARRIPEIPAKPVWSEFHNLEEYQKMSADPKYLPVGYDAANASVYGIPLLQTYCYLITGMARSGKTNFLKVCIQAALEKDSVVCVIDGTGRDLKNYGREDRVIYAVTEQELYDFFEKLLPVFKERNQLKNQMLSEDFEEDEIFAAMSKEKPYFIFISDLSWFVPLIYRAELDMRGFLENIISKGRLHNIYFFADMSLENRTFTAGHAIYEFFTGYKTGIHFGGKTLENPILNYDHLSFAEKSKTEAPGIGAVPNVSGEGAAEKVVVPLARK